MNIILYLAEAFLVAYVMRLVAYRFKIPAVSGYVVGGVLLGGSLFFWIHLLFQYFHTMTDSGVAHIQSKGRT